MPRTSLTGCCLQSRNLKALLSETSGVRCVLEVNTWKMLYHSLDNNSRAAPPVAKQYFCRKFWAPSSSQDILLIVHFPRPRSWAWALSVVWRPAGQKNRIRNQRVNRGFLRSGKSSHSEWVVPQCRGLNGSVPRAACQHDTATGNLAVPVTARPRLLTPETATVRKARVFPEAKRKNQPLFHQRLMTFE